MLVKFLDDATLVAELGHLLTVAKEALEAKRKEFGKNVIDPFAAMFEMAGFGLDHAAWVNAELMRQAQKTLLNLVGEFHQNILGAARDIFEHLGFNTELQRLGIGWIRA